VTASPAVSPWHDAIEHHIWANERVLAVCADLTREQLSATVPGTYGPILSTLHHLVGTDGWYLSFFLAFENPIGDDPDVTIDQLRAANAANGERWRSVLSAEPDPERDVVEDGDGWRFHTPVAFRYAQTVQHGTDHRSQVCTGLTALGIEPPQIDVWAYGEATGRSRAEYLTAEA
jgi:uncharacterized damage-inducible protein DinB